MSGFDDQGPSLDSDLDISPKTSNVIYKDNSNSTANTSAKLDYKHVSFINVLPDLEDYEYQRLLNNNRELTSLNDVLHPPPTKQSIKHSHSHSSSFNSNSCNNIDKYNTHPFTNIYSSTASLTSLCNKPLDFNKIVEEQEKLANENANMNAGRRSSSQTLNKFSNLREVEDVKFSSENGNGEMINKESSKNMSKIGSIANGKNISDMSLEEIQFLEDQLSRNRRIRKDSSQDYDFTMVQDSSRGVWQNTTKHTLINGRINTSLLSKRDLDIMDQQEKLLLQNGYPTRPWVRNNACILNYKHSNKVARTVFVYVSGREHTWTSLEYYFKYIQRDNDHLIIGSWVPRTDVIQPEFEKSQFSELLHFKQSINYYKEMENMILSSCHDLLNYAIYKNNLNNSKPIQITCTLDTNDDPHQIFLDFMNEYEPMLNIITSVTFNHFIKFQNNTIKMANFFTKFLSSCIVINQDYLAMPMHQYESKNKEQIKNKTQITAKESIDLIDNVIENTCTFPYEDCTANDMTRLHKYEPSAANVAFKKYHYFFPQVPLKVDTKLKVTTPEGFFIRFGYMRPKIEELHYSDYDPAKEDITINKFYEYLNTRRSLQWIQSRYELAIAKFKPSLFYIDKTNGSNDLEIPCAKEYQKRFMPEFDNNSSSTAAMMMLKKVVSGGAASNGGNNSNPGSRRGSVNSLDYDDPFRKVKSNDSSSINGEQQNYDNYYNQDYYLEKEKEEKKKLKEKQDKLKREMEREMNMTSGKNLVKQKQDVMRKFKEERRQLQKMKSENSAQGISPTTNSNNIQTEKSNTNENNKKKGWKFW